MSKKYELTDEVFGQLRRIRALRDIPRFGVKAGDEGGWIMREENLLQYNDAWVSGNAQISGDALVSGNARVYDNAWVYGDTQVSGSARVSGDAQVQKASDVWWSSVVGADNGTLTAYRTTKSIELTRGCFRGTIEQFIEKSAKRPADEQHLHEEYLALIAFIRLRFGVN